MLSEQRVRHTPAPEAWASKKRKLGKETEELGAVDMPRLATDITQALVPWTQRQFVGAAEDYARDLTYNL